ncbi:Uu.00g144250.m01.CDS01 [Anthostomella pinea]|uniref:Uu.00g144250.m01.CDS01 n=1 Tax=Anthostomella pinea TaxID=933095 RepID=A0AAI8VRH4_9PEZI|nr:Uu.00g144250.m01.CDS01 [Anthostomella pinea]
MSDRGAPDRRHRGRHLGHGRMGRLSAHAGSGQLLGVVRDREKLNPVWHAGAYTNQLCVINPTTGNAIFGINASNWIYNTTISEPARVTGCEVANSILYYTLKNAISLAVDRKDDASNAAWTKAANPIPDAINSRLWDASKSLYRDNDEPAGSPYHNDIHPKDGNAWAVIAGITNATQAEAISTALQQRWIRPYGAPAPEAGDTISPFASGFELQAHFLAGHPERAVDLMEFMWADFMLDDPRMTRSTFIEGYSTDGSLRYAPYAGSDARISHAHGWSTAPTSLLTFFAAGLKLTGAGGATWSVEPQLGPLSRGWTPASRRRRRCRTVLETQGHVPSFTDLPPELRLMVLEFVLEDKSQAPPYWLSRHATVCREWQFFFEQRNFRFVKLRQDDLEAFRRVYRPQYRQGFARTVWLRIELPEYGCERCETEESDAESRTNNLIFTRAVWKLFSILRTWDRRAKAWVNLDLSAHSPSDGQHRFKEISRRAEDIPWASPDRPIRSLSDPFFQDSAHQWQGGMRPLYSSYEAKSRVMGPIQGLCFDYRAIRATQNLPKAEVVRTFAIRRQFLRGFSIQQGLRHILAALPNVEQVWFEPWRGISDEHRRHLDHQYLALASALSRLKHLKTVSFFEDYSKFLHPISINTGYGREFHADGLGPLLARMSTALESLSVCFVVDAVDFFRDFMDDAEVDSSKPYWAGLKQLALTSEYLDPEHFRLFLTLVARAAERMPRLTRLRIWNTTAGSECFFTYSITRYKQVPSLCIRSTWHCRLGKGERRVWANLARKHGHTRHNLRVTEWDMDRFLIHTHGYLVGRTTMDDTMLTNTSYQQVWMESS